MSNLPIVFTDTCGTHLEIDRYGGARTGNGDVLLRTGWGSYFILTADVDLIAAISEAAGKPAPIVLECPELVATCSLLPGFRIAPDDGKLHVHGEARMTPQQARTLAAYIVARADVLEAAEPDPAEVAALAGVIRENGTSMGNSSVARAILRAGYRPPERKDGER